MPVPCEHFPEDKNKNCIGAPPACEEVKPLVETIDGATCIKCPRCNLKTHRWARIRWAIDEWNRMVKGYYSEHWEPPKWIGDDL